MSLTGLGEVADLIKSVSDKIWPDATQREQNLAALQTQVDAAQAAIDQQEASSNSLFVSGWRPAVGWCCAAAFIYHLLLQPFLMFFMAAVGHSFPLPAFDTGMLTTVLMGMLGLGTLHAAERMGDKGYLPWQK